MILSFAKILLVSVLLPFTEGGHPIFSNNGETLSQFLASNMIYPSYAKQNCIQGTIKVSFHLNKQGGLSNAKIKKGFGVGLNEEAIRLIKLTAHKWSIPKNHKESTEIIIPIKFALQNYNCESLSKQSIQKAVSLYQTRTILENVVTSYYKNRTEGNTNTKSEQQINQFKADLGFNQELVDEKLTDAKQMLKQGDKESACEILNFIRNIGFPDADKLIAENCK